MIPKKSLRQNGRRILINFPTLQPQSPPPSTHTTHTPADLSPHPSPVGAYLALPDSYIGWPSRSDAAEPIGSGSGRISGAGSCEAAYLGLACAAAASKGLASTGAGSGGAASSTLAAAGRSVGAGSFASPREPEPSLPAPSSDNRLSKLVRSPSLTAFRIPTGSRPEGPVFSGVSCSLLPSRLSSFSLPYISCTKFTMSNLALMPVRLIAFMPVRLIALTMSLAFLIDSSLKSPS